MCMFDLCLCRLFSYISIYIHKDVHVHVLKNIRKYICLQLCENTCMNIYIDVQQMNINVYLYSPVYIHILY